jgi:hypothetical protein
MDGYSCCDRLYPEVEAGFAAAADARPNSKSSLPRFKTDLRTAEWPRLREDFMLDLFVWYISYLAGLGWFQD